MKLSATGSQSQLLWGLVSPVLVWGCSSPFLVLWPLPFVVSLIRILVPDHISASSYPFHCGLLSTVSCLESVLLVLGSLSRLATLMWLLSRCVQVSLESFYSISLAPFLIIASLLLKKPKLFFLLPTSHLEATPKSVK